MLLLKSLSHAFLSFQSVLSQLLQSGVGGEVVILAFPPA